MSESKLRDLSTDFAIKIIQFCEKTKGHYSLTNQLERSATSIGANIHEANYAHSRADFISKLQISLKECYETEPIELTLSVLVLFVKIHSHSSFVCKGYILYLILLSVCILRVS